jgi:hypothetical protein
MFWRIKCQKIKTGKVIQTGRKVYHINNGQKTMKKSLGGRKIRNESYFTGSIKCMVDSCSC